MNRLRAFPSTPPDEVRPALALFGAAPVLRALLKRGAAMGRDFSGSHADTRGFSLVELVIVIVIIGILAAIAVPRFSHASNNSAESAFRYDLKTLRHAIDLYAAEHRGDWPGLRDAGSGAGLQNGTAYARQLTWYTDESGDAVTARDATHIFGPYLVKIPALPIGSRAGQNAVATTNHFSTPGVHGDAVGWEAEHYFGRIRANLPDSEVGSDGVPYCDW